MIIGIGVDIVEVPRIQAVIDRHGEHFLRRVFTEQEVAYCRSGARPPERFAGRFAAKEAALKALGTGWQHGTSFREVEVTTDELGAPALRLSGHTLELSRTRGVLRWHVSLSHDRHYAVAQVVAEADAS
jgi:holo-[acyl-carrier protein] synthase